MDPALEWSKDLESVVNIALNLAQTYNTSPMDSLHLAAATLLSADEFCHCGTAGTAHVSCQPSQRGLPRRGCRTLMVIALCRRGAPRTPTKAPPLLPCGN